VSVTTTERPPAPPPEPAPEPRPRTLLQRVLNVLILPTLAIITALAVGAIVIIFSDPDALEAWGNFFSDPLEALEVSWETVRDAYEALFRSSLGSATALTRTLQETTPLLFAGLSVALAFRAGLFNIGASGQLMMGAAAAGYVGFTWDLPAAIHLPLALLAGFLAGMVWGGIAGVLKARTGAHEVITTIMLNFIALRLLDYLLSTDAFKRPGRDDPISPPVAESARLPEFDVGLVTINLGLILGLLAAWGVWWLMFRSTVGFRMRAVGTNPDAARYAGMAVGATYILAMGLAGGLAGLAGTTNLLSVPSYSLTGGYFNTIGFDAIALALLGRAHPAGVVGAALLFGILRAGATGMQAATDTPIDIILVIQSLIIAFVAAPALVRSIWRVRGEGLGRGQTFTTSWGG
jgi:general nucleoside transport system permease protein